MLIEKEVSVDSRILRIINGKIALVGILLAVILVYYPSLFLYFSQDDYQWLNIARESQFCDVLQTLFKYNHVGSYRPLTQEVYFYVNKLFFGLNPMGYHFFNFLFHLFNTILIYKIVSKLNNKVIAFFSAFYFGINTAHFVSVSWVSAFSEIGVTFFYFCSVYSFILYREKKIIFYFINTLIFFVLALMSKEMAVTLPIILVFIDVLFFQIRKENQIVKRFPIDIKYYKPHVYTFVILACYLFVRIIFPYKGMYELKFQIQDLIFNYANYLLWALNINNITKNGLLYLGLDPFSIKVFLGVIIIVFILISIRLIRHKVVLFGNLTFLVGLAPVIPLNQHAFAYYLSIPLLGLSYILSYLMVLFLKKIKKLGFRSGLMVTVFLMIFLICFAVNRVDYQGSWVVKRANATEQFTKDLRKLKIKRNSVLYFINIPERDWIDVFQNGLVVRLIYPDIEIRTLLDTKDSIPQNFREMENFYVLKMWNGKLYDITKEFKSGDDSYFAQRLYTLPIINENSKNYSKNINFDYGRFDEQLGSGWYDLEGQRGNGYRWTKKEAVAYFYTENLPDHEVKLRIKGYSIVDYFPNKTLQVRVFVNNKFTEKIFLSKEGEFTLNITLQRENLTNLTEIKLVMSNTYVPDKCIKNGDSRELGVIIKQISLE